VISWKSTRRIGTTGAPRFGRTWSATCWAIASPSRSGSVAIRTSRASLAALLRSAIVFSLPGIGTSSGSKPPSTSMPSFFSGRSMMWPTVAFTRYPRPRYLPIVLAFAGDSTITSDGAFTPDAPSSPPGNSS
jgi:hypothetical protein